MKNYVASDEYDLAAIERDARVLRAQFLRQSVAAFRNWIAKRLSSNAQTPGKPA